MNIKKYTLKAKILLHCIALCMALLHFSCGIYSFKDTTIPPEIENIRIAYIGNNAPYVTPQLSPGLTDAFVKLVAKQTKLRRIEDNSADYVVEAKITDYKVSTEGISQTQASINRLSIVVHIVLIDNKNNKTSEYDVTRNFDFSASKSLNQAEAELMPDIIKTLSEDIFTKIFSNW